MKFNYFLIILLLIIGSSCTNKDKEVSPTLTGVDFFPTKVGTYREYEVREIKINLVKSDTLDYRLRETIIDSAKKVNSIIYFVRREKKDKNATNWKKVSLWSLSKTQNYLSITDNNIQIMKMVFPVSDKKTWNGNSLNSGDKTSFSYEKTAKSPIDSIKTNQLITVVLSNSQENVTGKDVKKEIYARGIGLISKDYFTTEKCTSSSCKENLGKVVGGNIISQKLVALGKAK